MYRKLPDECFFVSLRRKLSSFNGTENGCYLMFQNDTSSSWQWSVWRKVYCYLPRGGLYVGLNPVIQRKLHNSEDVPVCISTIPILVPHYSCIINYLSSTRTLLDSKVDIGIDTFKFYCTKL
jgi:hypothetical protein